MADERPWQTRWTLVVDPHRWESQRLVTPLQTPVPPPAAAALTRRGGMQQRSRQWKLTRRLLQRLLTTRTVPLATAALVLRL